MSDREGRGAPNDDELSLPRATVAKMIQGTGLHQIFHFTPLPSVPFNTSHPSAARGVQHDIVLSLRYYFRSLPRNRVANIQNYYPRMLHARRTREIW